jgi:hypothetical protein
MEELFLNHIYVHLSPSFYSQILRFTGGTRIKVFGQYFLNIYIVFLTFSIMTAKIKNFWKTLQYLLLIIFPCPGISIYQQ